MNTLQTGHGVIGLLSPDYHSCMTHPTIELATFVFAMDQLLDLHTDLRFDYACLHFE